MNFDLDLVEQILKKAHTIENGWVVKLKKFERLARDERDAGNIHQGFLVITIQQDDGDLD